MLFCQHILRAETSEGMAFLYSNKNVEVNSHWPLRRSILRLQCAQQRSRIFRSKLFIGLKTSLRTVAASHHEANGCNGITRILSRRSFWAEVSCLKCLRAVPIARFILAPRQMETFQSGTEIDRVSAKATGTLESNDGIIWEKRSLKFNVRSVHDLIDTRSLRDQHS